MTTARRESESSMVQPSGSAGSARRGGGAGRRESLLTASMQHNDEKTRNINDALDEGHTVLECRACWMMDSAWA